MVRFSIFFKNCLIRAYNTSFLIHFRCWIRIWGYCFENRYQLINIGQSIFHHHIRKSTHKMYHTVRFQDFKKCKLSSWINCFRCGYNWGISPPYSILDWMCFEVFFIFIYPTLRFSVFFKNGPQCMRRALPNHTSYRNGVPLVLKQST